MTSADAPSDGPALRLVLGDQLSRSVAALRDLDPARDVVLIAEVQAEASYVPHHPKKIAFLFSAMRHFAAELESEGVRVRYVRLEDPENSGDLGGEIARAFADEAVARLVCTACGEHRLDAEMRGWAERLDRPVEIRADDRFLCDLDWFFGWAEGRKMLRMEHFYREMRRATGLLMTGDGEPEGGRWNFDHDNRKPPDANTGEGGLFRPPHPPRFRPDETTQAVLALVDARFGDRFGDVQPFDYAVTRADAEAALDAFIAERLALFGDYQDAMTPSEDHLYHAVLSLYLNAGLLDPMSVCRAAERAYHEGRAPLNAVEGFIRQILGWREYVRGIYWLKGPDYGESNFFEAERDLPGFYWTGETEMACLAHAIEETKRLAYAHHIQRLMLTGTFALLAGIAPKQVCAWYLAVYADAYEWVELPNTHGMALYADGGVMASKPYAASGKYIDRMSTYCKGCAYDVKKRTGPGACPFNYLYWDFLMRNEDKLKGNPRMGMPLKTLNRMTPATREDVRRDAAAFLDALA
ncbi:MAG: cryptochrome/photolyase family protein [Marivibrio sp.]|uniref:cryptochrome/photolyase family protein n=1 Tax=Marivibrio sp. TaxID=2039719 RepID=UPI0032EE51A2